MAYFWQRRCSQYGIRENETRNIFLTHGKIQLKFNRSKFFYRTAIKIF